MDQLPEYMKICFLALFNSSNEIAYDILKEKGSNIIRHLRKRVRFWIPNSSVTLLNITPSKYYSVKKYDIHIKFKYYKFEFLRKFVV